MSFLQRREEIEPLVKKWGWTFVNGSLCVLLLWQGLTLFRQVQSWQSLKSTSEKLLMGVGSRDKKADTQGADPNARSVESTFFFHPPKPTYKLTAVMEDYAIINGETVKAGGRVGNATVESISADVVTLKRDGEESPLTIDVHFGARGEGVTEYNLSSILGGMAVINGKPVGVGDRIGQAVVQEVDGKTVKILEDGAETPKTLDLK